MPTHPFRFIHASDFHLERPLMGVAEVPDHLRELFLEAPYTAARQVFDAALAEEVDFVLLGGGIAVPSDTGPRGPLMLAQQFARLAAAGIGVYWAGSPIDPPEAWPAVVKLPDNVHFFPCGQVENLLVQRDGVPLARLVGTSCDPQRPWRPEDFPPSATVPQVAPVIDIGAGPTAESPTATAGLPNSAANASGLFTIALAHGEAEPAALQSRGVNYWALGGRHDRSTPAGGPAVIHYCGSSQGRRPDESGVHGCTLVQVDSQHQVRTSLIPTDAARWISQRATIDEATTRELLETQLRERLNSLLEAMPATPLLVSWTISGRGPLLAPLRRGKLANDLLQSLRADYGHRSPPAWSVSLELELSDTLPPEWYGQETIRGEFLRAIRQLQMNPGEPLDFDRYLSEPHRAGTLAAAVAVHSPHARDAVLREAASLGADLLSGEEPET
ncbi:MAG: hypothetical protein LLG00_07020 [Planctomycetaceae bacterium]|nr:hypothetical protein [Planctomycetaceae bacterium]